MTSKVQRDAEYLLEMYRQSGRPLAEKLYHRIVEQDKLTIGQASALAQNFRNY